ncbi:MAG: 50S ribosomal protein L18 [Betaproteobacteria bacterium]|jgi:large subunit ribosomal protein L18
MKDKNQARVRRSKRTRHVIKNVHAVRLTVHRSNGHIYAQVIDATGSKVLACASTVEPEVRASLKNGGNVAAAVLIGKRIAEKAKQAGVEAVAFDRSGYRYHGRVKALADAARENGLKF